MKLFALLLLFLTLPIVNASAQFRIHCVSKSGARISVDPAAHSVELTGSADHPMEGKFLILGVVEQFQQSGKGLWVQNYDLDEPYYVVVEIFNNGDGIREVKLYRRGEKKKLVEYDRCAR